MPGHHPSDWLHYAITTWLHYAITGWLHYGDHELAPLGDHALAPIKRSRSGSNVAVNDTTVGEAELRHGVAILPAGKRRNALTTAIEGLLDEDFRDRVLPFDRAAARAYATIAAARRAAGRPISQFDCQIAAIARAHEAPVATRNTSDYEGCGVELIDPWTYGARQ